MQKSNGNRPQAAITPSAMKNVYVAPHFEAPLSVESFFGYAECGWEASGVINCRSRNPLLQFINTGRGPYILTGKMATMAPYPMFSEGF